MSHENQKYSVYIYRYKYKYRYRKSGYVKNMTEADIKNKIWKYRIKFF